MTTPPQTQPKRPPKYRPKPGASQVEIAALEDALGEIESREKEFLRLYEPLPFQQQFHSCTTKECILAKGVRVGGTLCTMVEVARAVLGMDPFGKYPASGTCILLGYGEKHIGNVFHRYLFKDGGSRIKILKDRQTGKWRCYRPWSQKNGGDLGDEDRCELAPALIPAKYVEEIIWEKMGHRIFSKAVVRTPKGVWEILTANSAGDPNQLVGIDCDLYLIDEDLATGGWHEEAVARTALVDGKIRWAGVPAEKTEDMMRMLERAKKQAGHPNPTTVLVEASIFDNRYMSDSAREESMAIWRDAGEDVVQRRAFGKLSTDSIRMYPRFDETVHSAIPLDLKSASEVQKIMAELNGQPPPEWCRYVAIDPGHTTLAVLFAAVPPPEVGDQVVVYDELYIHQADAQQLGEAMSFKAVEQDFEEFIIDAQGGRLSGLAYGENSLDVYQQVFEDLNIQSRKTGYGFAHGSTDIPFRENVLRMWLRIRKNGTPRFLVVMDQCPNFVREIRNLKKKRINSPAGMVTTDKKDDRQPHHLVDCAEYLVARDLPYVKPPPPREQMSWLERYKRANRPRRKWPAWMSRKSISLGPGGQP